MSCCNIHFYVNIKAKTEGNKASYPTIVYDVNGVYIGVANNAEEYALLWNNDEDNALLGSLKPAEGKNIAFLFTAIEPVESAPVILGDPLYRIIDSDGIPLQDGKNNYITYK